MSIWLFDKLYSYAWFVGFGVAGIIYFVLMKVAPSDGELHAEAT
jgi:cytosine/uracil/thiamine/allantoin permease